MSTSATASSAPYRGMTAIVPPASIPLGFLLASGIGFAGFGFGIAAIPSRLIVTPTDLSVVGVVHIGMLAALSTALLGALHQFIPVVTASQLRSNKVAAMTLAIWPVGTWLLPVGFLTNLTLLIIAGGTIVVVSALLATWNFSAALMRKSDAEPVTGLRSSIVYFVLTVTFGIVYAFDLHHGWFGLLPNRVLAHAVLGLVGWLGISYVAVAEKLWPMFLLSHKEKRGAGWLAVRILPFGLLLLVIGLLFQLTTLGVAGGTVAAMGLAAHGGSFIGWIRKRRRKLELLHAFVITAFIYLATMVITGTLAALAPLGIAWRTRLTVTSVAAASMWIALAIVGHAHKIVPFITWTKLREKGVSRRPDGKALLFGDLYNLQIARAAFAGTTLAGAVTLYGILTATRIAITTGGLLLAASSLATTGNLAIVPRILVKRLKEKRDDSE